MHAFIVAQFFSLTFIMSCSVQYIIWCWSIKNLKLNQGYELNRNMCMYVKEVKMIKLSSSFSQNNNYIDENASHGYLHVQPYSSPKVFELLNSICVVHFDSAYCLVLWVVKTLRIIQTESCWHLGSSFYGKLIAMC